MASIFIALRKGSCIHCFAQRHLYSLYCPMASVYIALRRGSCNHCFAQGHLYSLLCPMASVFIALGKGSCIHCFAQRHLYSWLCPMASVSIALRKGSCIYCFAQRHMYPLLCHLIFMSSEFANNKGADQPVHLHRLISTFVICCELEILSKLATSKISIFQLVSVAEQTCLSLHLSETLKTVFFASRPKSCMMSCLCMVERQTYIDKCIRYEMSLGVRGY